MPAAAGASLKRAHIGLLTELNVYTDKIDEVERLGDAVGYVPRFVRAGIGRTHRSRTPVTLVARLPCAGGENQPMQTAEVRRLRVSADCWKLCAAS